MTPEDKPGLPAPNAADALPEEVSKELHGRGEVVQGPGFVISESFDGPLPPPSLLKQYEAVVPGLAHEIIADWREEGRHRRWVERTLVRYSGLGLLSATLVGIIGLGGGVWLAAHGAAMVGLTAFLGALASLVAVFLFRRDRPLPADQTQDPAANTNKAD
ncbi:MAG TPA: DUF2335 domain-containing protein [Longimicrobiaceae bacterium]|nr:DUF2335 domain-containing protein [Longimicrobiaceae bacterium]